MAVWGCRTFITMLNIRIMLKGFHQYMLRTKYWRHSEPEVLFSVNCINSFFFCFFLRDVRGIVFKIRTVSTSLCRMTAVWNLDLPPSTSPPVASLKTTILNRGWKEGAEAVLQILLETPHCTNELFMRKFLKKCCSSKGWERQRSCQ